MTVEKDATPAWGASREAWRHFAVTLGWAPNLLPVVSNPHRAISPGSTLKTLGKTPSQINFNGNATGIAGWTKSAADRLLLERWAREPDHGICVQTGKGIIAIDVDVPDQRLAQAIRETITMFRPDLPWAERYRADTGKTLFAVRYPWGDLFKRSVEVKGGVIELLALGQQFVCQGTHIHARTGIADGRYLWRAGKREGLPDPDDFPLLDEDELEDLWQLLVMLHGTADERRARGSRVRPGDPLDPEDLPDPEADPVAYWLAKNWPCFGTGDEHRLFIECPFKASHTTESGPTSTAYFPAGSGGYEQGHFLCKHAHCDGRTDKEFLLATGYEQAQYPVLPKAEPHGWPEAPATAPKRGVVVDDSGRNPHAPIPGLVEVESLPLASILGATDSEHLITDKGKIKATAYNVAKLLGNWRNITGRVLAHDTFREIDVWADSKATPPVWKPLSDTDYTKMRMLLELLPGMEAVPHAILREAVAAVAEGQAIDTARDWLDGLKWDGVPRVDGFMLQALDGVNVLHTPEYLRDLSRYIWTALAGRVLRPGVKADMVPILVGDEGIYKSTWVRALAPSTEAYVEIRFDNKEDDNIRLLQGAVVAELAELRGLALRTGEEIRAFLSRQVDQWTPKFSNLTRAHARRNIFVGTTNDDQFLEASMGARRLLPVLVVGKMRVDLLDRDRDQLWAEGAELFRRGGVCWDVEKTAPAEREHFKREDNWTLPVMRWLATDDGFDQRGAPMDWPHGVAIADVLRGALGFARGAANRAHEVRAGRVLRAIGAEASRQRVGAMRSRVWRFPDELKKRLAPLAESD